MVATEPLLRLFEYLHGSISEVPFWIAGAEDDGLIRGHKVKKPTPLAEKWKCVFHHPAMRAAVDVWISTEWQRTLGGKAPFGDLRQQWRREHCRTLNPYGSEDCPYQPIQCVAAFREAVAKTMASRPDTPVGYFKKVARMDAARRADEGVDKRIRQRYRAPETNVPQVTDAAQGSGHAGHEDEGLSQGRGMHSPANRPTGIGELLGTLDIRPRPLDPDEGKEGA